MSISFAYLYTVIDPVLIRVGPLPIRWYSLAYIAGLLLGWMYILRLLRTPRLWQGAAPIPTAIVGDFIVWNALGVIVGGRLGHVLLYDPSYYFAQPAKIFFVWQGGMAFHGGLIGAFVASWLFSHYRRLPLLTCCDLMAAAVPIGLFFGRIANYINAELGGRPTDVAWAVIYPWSPTPRHPSQLYEAFLEGCVLFLLLRLLTHRYRFLATPGLTAASALLGYGVFRCIAELFRIPDGEIFGLSLGMVYSIPMIVMGGGYLLWIGCHGRTARPHP